MDEVPEYVSRAAQEHRLGELVVWRKASNPFVTFIIATGITVIGGGLLLGVLWVLSRFIETLDTAVGAIVVVAGVALVGSAVAGVYALVKGFTAHYVYEHGAIQTRNRRVGVQKWEQLDEVAENWAGFPNNPSMVSILVRFFDGRRWEIEALPTGNQTERDRQLLTAFTDRALQQGRPVIHLPRVDIEEEFMPPRFLITVVVVLLVVVTCGLGGVLRGANLPDMLAYAIGFLTAGLGTWVIGQAFRWLRIMGMVFAALGGFSLIIYVTNVLSSVNLFLIGLATFALELLAV